MNDHDRTDHRKLRELLGAYALGGLPDQDGTRLRAHLDGCAACRAELAEIAPLAAPLRRIDPDVLSTVATPPPDLGERILGRIGEERALVEARARRADRRSTVRRHSRQWITAAAAAALLIVALAAGTVVGRTTAPELRAAPPSAGLPIEDIRLRAVDGSVTTESAVVVAHSWGIEARFVASGLAAGEVYRAAFRAEDGSLFPAGEFLGVGEKALTCNMQSALSRDETVGFVITDEAGTPVLVADL